MKIFTLPFFLLLLSLGVSRTAVSASAFTGDCGCKDSENELKNGGFESGTENWKFDARTKDDKFRTDTEYDMCGSKNGLIEGAGTAYQEVSVVGGSKVTLTVYGGTHKNQFEHKIYLTFYQDNTLVPVTANDHNTKSMNFEVGNQHKLQQYSLWENAPANANKVRISFYSGGNFFKIDVACMSFTPPAPTSCTSCAENQTVIKNSSFENGTAEWSKFNGTDFYSLANAAACGSKLGKIDGSGTVYQGVNVVPGAAVTVSVYAATNDPWKTNNFFLVFYNSSGQEIGGSHNKSVEVNQNVNSGLAQYTHTSTAPTGAVKVYVAFSSNGGRFYFDAVCMSVTPPSQCESCTANKLVNEGFESGTASWNVEGTMTADADSKNCGTSGGKLAGAGKFYQDFTFSSTMGSQVLLSIWGAKDNNGGQKFEIIFLDGSNKVLGSFSRDVTKIFSAAPSGLEKYSFGGAIAPGTTTIRVQGSATSGVFRVDQSCLQLSGSPLPVTLAAFDVKKEGNTASLKWSTSYESNSDHFDVQHSQDGKSWIALTTIQAGGESKALIEYSYTHTSPLAVNLYRLKMVDADGTFAYSSIRSLNFSVDVDIVIYPNPATDRIKFTAQQQIENVKVYNAGGVLVLNTLPTSSNEVDLTKLAQGAYFIKVNNSPIMRKVLVVR